MITRRRSGLVVLMTLVVGACSGRVAAEGGEAGDATAGTSTSSDTDPLADLPGEPLPDLPTPILDCDCEPGTACVITWADFGCQVGCRPLPSSCGDAPSCDPACNWDLCEHVQCNGEQQLDDDCGLTHYQVTGWVCSESMFCNPWLDQCPDNEGCHPYASDESWWHATLCYWPGDSPAAVGESCIRQAGPFSGQDNCESHAICWDVDPGTGVGTCIPQCGNAPHDPSCPVGTDCVFADPMDAAFCLPACDPFADACAPGYRCTKVGDTLACMPSATDLVGLGQPCEYPNQCEDTLACIDGECAALCALSSPACPPESPNCVDAQTNVAQIGVCGS